MNSTYYRRITKQRCVEYLGGVCVDCGIQTLPAVYDFHHRNPDEKSFDIATRRNWSFERLVAELDKCDLLCANCHRIRHALEGAE